MEFPFASKIFGHKQLYVRKHGNGAIVAPSGADIILDIVVPYASCRFNELEVIGCTEGMSADLKIMMGNTMLNQFGFDVALPTGMYTSRCPYDVELSAGVTIRLILKGATQEKYYGMNVVLHEMVAI
jgi:hypothetical protein